MQKEIWEKQNILDYQLLKARDAERLQGDLVMPPAVFRQNHEGVPD